MKMRFKSCFLFLVTMYSGKLFAEGKYANSIVDTCRADLDRAGDLSARSFVSLPSANAAFH